MKREEVRNFLKAGADAVQIFFDAGRLTEFNKVPDKGEPFSWVHELQAKTNFGGSGSTLIDDWSVKIRIAKRDRLDSIQDEYENLVDNCDHIARKLIWQFNVILFGAGNITTANQDLYKLITLDNVEREPFYKWGADCLTGVDLSFTLNIPDKTDVCP